MKTSELMSKLNEIAGIRAFHKSRISVLDSTSECLAEVGTSCSFLNIYKNCPYEVSKLIVEYYLTPISEREEEKKYSLKSKLFEFGTERHLYLINSTLHKQYCLALNISQSFTQKEIDAMPFDTNFFVKEEVK